MNQLTEKERVDIAWFQYSEDLTIDSNLLIANEVIDVGTVKAIHNDISSGLYAIEVLEPDGDVTLLFRGSESPGNEGWQADWLDNNLSLAGQIIHNQAKEFYQPEVKLPTPQLQASAELLKDVMVSYPEAKISIYGHSLGSMDAQYALASVPPAQHHRIEGAWVYNGPNIYSILTDVEQSNVEHLKHKIINYIDPKDKIGLGYPKTGSEGAVGLVKRVESRFDVTDATQKMSDSNYFSLNGIDRAKTVVSAIAEWFVDQHLWGGYQYNPDDSVKLSKENQEIFDREYAHYSKKNSPNLDVQNVVGSYIAQLKTSYESLINSGNISSSDMLFLDASQAMAVSKGLSQVALQGENDVKTLSAELISQLEDNYSKTNQTYGTSLTPGEVRSVLAEAGANHYHLVTKYREKASQHEQVMAELSQQFSSLENQLHSGISETVALDQELGGLFAQ